MPKEWSKKEVEAIVDDYLIMLSLELAGENYNKTEHRRTLLPKLDSRSDGSIEFKHQNISAVLIEMGLPYISGYKPKKNYQRAVLPEVLNSRISKNKELLSIVQKDVETVSDVPTVEDILNSLVVPPEYEQNLSKAAVQEPSKPYGMPRQHYKNYLAIEALNTKLGLLGEKFVINYEKARLIYRGRESLADKIDQVSVTIGDKAGFDVLSYEDDGKDRFIEVKTTKYGKETPFYITRNELEFSNSNDDKYHLYRVFSFRKKPQLFTLRGNVGNHCSLKPTQFMATF
ncbi:MAG: DUF3883 domain-containing protein [Nitrospirota bacterium]